MNSKKRKETWGEPKQDDLEAGDLEGGEFRTEGTDAHVFAQSIGFVPRYPDSPKYIKVRSHGKKEKDFNHLFLAQELRGRTGVEIAQAGGRLVKNGFKPGDTRKDGNAVWAMEFSKDGKHLAAGGQDFTVRVWAVISTSEERRAHETEEDAEGKNGDSVRLSAPVFNRKPVQEYAGHEASILDISWSKVGASPDGDGMAPHMLTSARTISSCHPPWIRRCGCGTSAESNVYAASSTGTL
jgi:WD40 repeat protein